MNTGITSVLSRVTTTLLFIALAGCTKSPALQQLKGFAQGTSYHISYWSASPIDAQAVKKAVDNEFATIDKLLSNYRPDSVIEVFNRSANTGSQEVGPEIVQLARIASAVHQASQGCYDLTIKPLFTLWGFNGERPSVPNDKAIADTLKQIGMAKLTPVDDTHLSKKQAELQVDLSSIAQGYSVESISRVLEKHGVNDYMVEIGGELKTRGHKPDHSSWRIAIEKPLPGEHQLHKILSMPQDATLAIMTSGTYRHYFDANGQRYGHILDARTGRPVTHDLVSVTVAHADPVIADAWSTALLCLGQEQGIKTANAEHLAALFIRLQNNQLLESQTDSFTTLNILTQP
ncbi:FAD:protein FMN transferase [Methylomicrobium sp. Wu6]|uniref:FAD:protein FMN transferase n=1 Tax=Methylomicrobium sp. Wu6 TaxID=3107928 RepID=UPI002DD6A14E|nr:FAD:protein FMN transferase [Methylomicrobium sp. Wu6]MEC4750566.1 FAD:protein FMN transferase [Methylomicrobium sp. Wu6]